jgi:hypothetical protein
MGRGDAFYCFFKKDKAASKNRAICCIYSDILLLLSDNISAQISIGILFFVGIQK